VCNHVCMLKKRCIPSNAGKTPRQRRLGWKISTYTA